MHKFLCGNNVRAIRLNNGKVLEAEKIDEITKYIIDKFAEEKLSIEEADFILENTKTAIREWTEIQKVEK